MNTLTIKRLLQVNVALLALNLLAACGAENSRKRSHAQAPQLSDDQTASVPQDTEPNKGDDKKTEESSETSLTMPSAAIGVRNFEQIVQTFAKLTGVSARNTTVTTAVADLKSSLPDSNDMRTLTPAKISGITKLAATFCDVAMADATLRAKLYPGINFGVGPTQALADPKSAITALLQNVWGADVVSNSQGAADIVTLTDLLKSMMVGKANTAAMTANLLMGTCAAALASSPAITL